MSGFERALLESKERNELSQIAESLGKKPPARMKKSSIIDLIFELAGVTDEPAAEAEPTEAQLALDPVAPVEPAEAPAPAAEADEPAEATDDAPSDDAPTEDAATPDAAPAPEKGGRDGGRNRGGERGQERGQGQDRKGGQSNQGTPANQGGQGTNNQGGRGQGHQNQGGGDRNQGGGGQGGGGNQDRNQGGQNQGGQNQGGQGGPNERNPNERGQTDGDGDGDDGDEGNRRRRRRGRNRDGQPDQYEGDPVDVEGLLDLREDGYGFLRLRGYLPSTDDVYVSVKQVRQFGLRKGDTVSGKSRPASRNEKNPALLQIDGVNGKAPDAARERRRFEDLTPLFPDERLPLETAGAAATMTTRIIDLLAPIGKGQRGLIVSPPKAGKTTIMKQVARSIELNSPDVTLIVLLVDERPEEVTDMKRWLINGEVAASTFDRPSEEHIHVAELVIERAKRMVEDGKDVVIMLDGITRLARAYNLAAPPSGRIMSGGIDAAALYPPKKFFGAARNAEEGGSLTILATALVETGSKMDEHIFEEFKGTGNMELRLSRRLAERRVFPAIDVDASSTRHEELLFERRQVAQVDTLRKVLGAVKDGEGASDAAALELLLDRLKTFKTNKEFLDEVGKARATA
ncbi:MAG TPA: transcription termination factor Rho [Iamia sp.]|nr:transcription termination factor Rho [Iamia sp.]